MGSILAGQVGKQTLVYIISLMSVALIGLIILQFYWINIALGVNEDRFRQNVNSALTSVVKKLEQHETLYLVKQQIQNNVKVADDFFLVEYDSNGTARWKEQQTVKIKQVYGSEELVEQGYAYEIEEEAIISKSGVAKKNKISDLKQSELNWDFRNNVALSDLDSGWQHRSNSRALGVKLAEKSEMISLILKELMINEQSKDIQERISQPLLDSLLQEEISQRGIKTPYDFGVKHAADSMKEKLLFCNAPDSRRQDLLDSEFKIRLFPDDIFDKKNTLYLHFPHQNAFLIKKLWAVLLSSVLFISLILFSSLFAVFTIIRQKKLSEITRDFINNMTHELKTPISTVSLACEALLDPEIRQLPKQSNRYLHVIKDENSRLALQVEKVLQIARLDRGDFKLKIVSCNLHQIIQSAIQNINIQIESREGIIHTHLEAENPYIEADEVHISNIVHNLLDNANKYSTDQPDITIRTRDAEAGVQLIVADKGQGISKEAISKVFDKFYRVPTGNLHNVKGFGLGLSYVKTMVDAHQGEIKLKSELGQGSTFIIYFPHHHGTQQ